MTDARQLLRELLKSPAVWAAFVALLNRVLVAAFPQLDPKVVDAVNDFIVVVGIIVSTYYAGKAVQRVQIARAQIAQAPLRGLYVGAKPPRENQGE